MECNQDNKRKRFLSEFLILFLIKIFLLTTMTHQSKNTSSTASTITVITTHKIKTFYAIANVLIDTLRGINQIKIGFLSNFVSHELLAKIVKNLKMEKRY